MKETKGKRHCNCARHQIEGIYSAEDIANYQLICVAFGSIFLCEPTSLLLPEYNPNHRQMQESGNQIHLSHECNQYMPLSETPSSDHHENPDLLKP